MFPEAGVGHAYASTEAGVAFEVNDGLAGFPADFLDHDRDGVELKLVDGALRIRSPRTAQRYLGAQHAACATATASSIPATWWSGAAIATSSPAAAAASSMSAD